MLKVTAKVILFSTLLQLFSPVLFMGVPSVQASPAGDNILISEVQYDPATPS